MNATIRPGASRQHKTLPEEDPEGFFDFLLDRVGILLDLKPAVMVSFIGQFEKISGHWMRIGRCANIGTWNGVRWCLMAAGHGPEFPRIDGVREKVDQLGETVIGHEGVGYLQELEFGGVGRENLTEGADLAGTETFGFEYLIGNLNSVIVLVRIEHPDPQFVDIVIGGEGMTVRINEGQI